MIGTLLFLLALAVGEDKPVPKFPIGKDTTYVLGPIDKEGYIDYEAALNERLGKGITPEKNANVLLWKAMGPTPENSAKMPGKYFKWLGIDEPPKSGDYFIPMLTFLQKHAELDTDQLGAALDQQDKAGQRPWLAKDFPQIAAWLKANEKPLAVTVEASKRPDYFHPLLILRSDKELGLPLLSSLQECRGMASALVARAMLHVAEGRIDDAWQDLLACHRLGRLISRGGILFEGLVGIAVDWAACNGELAYLDHAKLSGQQIRNRLKDLQGLRPLAPLADKLDFGERIVFLDALQMVRRNPGVSFPLFGGKARKPSIDRLDWTSTLRNGNRWYDRLTAAAGLRDRASREKEFEKIDKELDALYGDLRQSLGMKTAVSPLEMWDGFPDKLVGKEIGDALINLISAAGRKMQSSYDRSEQVNRNVHIAFALAAYQRDNGRYPAKLEDLAPKYLPAVPDDLFAAKALVYRPEGNGYLLYSVGINGKDEGGRNYSDDPAGDDLRVRMPLPELSREK